MYGFHNRLHSNQQNRRETRSGAGCPQDRQFGFMLNSVMSKTYLPSKVNTLLNGDFRRADESPVIFNTRGYKI
jgi:hypothetical protein